MLQQFQSIRALLSLVLIVVALLAGVACGTAQPGASSGASTQSTAEPITLPNAPGITVSAEALYGGAYRTGSWVPIRVTVQNDGTDANTEVHVGVNRESAAFATTLELPRGARKSVTVYAFVPNMTRRLFVRLMNGDQQLAQQSVTINPHAGGDRMVGLIGGDGGQMGVPDKLFNGMRLVSVPFDVGALPDQALGLITFDALVFNDVATETLTDGQRAALTEWVSRGGQLIIAGGAGAQRTLNGLPETLRPVRVTGLQQVAADTLIAPASGMQGELTVAQVESVSVPGSTTRSFPRPSSVLKAPGTQQPLIERILGRGSVIFFVAALNAPALVNWPDAPRFWSEVLPQPQSMPQGFAPTDISTDMFIESNVASVLTGLPALEFPSLLTLGLLLLTYIVLVGPITYLVLRRLDRQALGWVVVPSITLAFAVIAYSMGYAQRGGDLVFNQITIVEPLNSDDTASAMARLRSFVGVFSPSQETYSVTATSPETSGSGLFLRPISLQGPWDPTNTSQRGIFLQNPPSANGRSAHVTGLDVAQWSMRAMVTDEVRPYKGITAQVILEGNDLKGDVINNGDHPLNDVALVQGSRIARLGDVGPGERRSVDLKAIDPAARARFGGAIPPLSYLIYGEEMDRSSEPNGAPLSPDIQMRVRLLDSFYSATANQSYAQPLLIAWSNQSPLEVSVPDKRVARQQLTLVTFAPQIKVVGNAVSLDQGWLDRRFEADPSGICMGNQGVGVNLFDQPVISALSIPRSLIGMQVNELTLLTSADGLWPADANVALFDWGANDWVAQDTATNRALQVAQPERFVSSNGQVRVRLNGPLSQPNNAGCIYVDAKVKGTLP